MTDLETKINIIDELSNELSEIMEAIKSSYNDSLGYERLKRWKERAVKRLSAISKFESLRLKKKMPGPFNYVDPIGSLFNDIESYKSYLAALRIDLCNHPENYSRGFASKAKQRWIGFCEVISRFRKKTWLSNHPKKFGICLLALIVILGIVAAFVWPDYRVWFIVGVVFAALIAIATLVDKKK